MHTDYRTLDFELVQQVALLRFRKSQRMTPEMLQDLEQFFQFVEQALEVRAVVITGHENVFLTGLQPASLQKLEPIGIQAFLDYIQQVMTGIERCGKPVIAAVNGLASGLGLELALACHIVLAAEEARLSLPEASLGFLPLGGGLQRLLRRIGPGRALEMVLGAYHLTAQDAYEWGLLNHVFSQDVLVEKALEMAALFNQQAPLAVKQALRSVSRGASLPLTEALEMESHLNALCWNSLDLQEGIQAVLEQRPPVFRGR